MSLQPESASRDGVSKAAPLPFAMKSAPANAAMHGVGNGEPLESTNVVAKEPARDVARLEFSSVDAAPASGGADAGMTAQLKEEVSALEARLEELRGAAPRQVEEGKLLARLLARKEWEDELERRTAEDRAIVLRACEEFDRERTRYFAAVEGQVVKLALAIAGRVLHREAKMDPLLLSAAVRVALEKVKDESETRLRVPMAEAEAWNEAFGLHGDDSLRHDSRHDSGHDSRHESGHEPGQERDRGFSRAAAGVLVIGDPDMARGECVIETSVGTVELGIEAQMMEIEQGFFDLLKKRPA